MFADLSFLFTFLFTGLLDSFSVTMYRYVYVFLISLE